MRARVLGPVIAAVGLGLLAAPAAGSCAGPQVAVLGAPLTTVPADSADPTAEPYVSVRPGQALTVRMTNLGPCQDTHAGTGGCAGPDTPSPVVTAPPARTAVLVVEQGSRRWTLARARLGPADAELALDVVLPSSLRPGSATLSFEVDPSTGAGVGLKVA